jgi:hypothetical protein
MESYTQQAVVAAGDSPLYRMLSMRLSKMYTVKLLALLKLLHGPSLMTMFAKYSNVP